MKIINSSYEILTPLDEVETLKRLEVAGRVCYKSEDKITDESCLSFVNLIKSKNHLSVIEHVSMTVKFICDRGVSHELVRHRLASFSQESTRYVGYAVKPQKNKEMSEDEAVDLYESGLSMKRISDLSDGTFTEWGVYKILDKHDIERRPLGNTGLINKDFFETINTSEKAYLLGFIMADGSVRRNGNEVTVTQKDGWFIWRMLKDFIKPDITRGTDRDCESYKFTHEKIKDDLADKGIMPNKTYEFTQECADRLWSAIPENFIPDFLRGLLDGDGSVRFFKQNNEWETDSVALNWNGNKFLMSKIQGWLKDTHNYDVTVHKDGKSDWLYRIIVTSPDKAEVICKDMYKNFTFPYGHPNKTSRVHDRIGFNYTIAQWDHPKFQTILPSWCDKLTPAMWIWAEAMDQSEIAYGKMIDLGCSAQQARAVLPNSLKTEIVVTANLREWLHILDLRASKAAHPDMRAMMIPLQEELARTIPSLFTKETV